ncbi:MAG: TolC family protein [Planctomycetaceae bacterium]|nr:TolC family protein [Planctomycetaceae bacterium]
MQSTSSSPRVYIDRGQFSPIGYQGRSQFVSDGDAQVPAPRQPMRSLAMQPGPAGLLAGQIPAPVSPPATRVLQPLLEEHRYTPPSQGTPAYSAPLPLGQPSMSPVPRSPAPAPPAAPSVYGRVIDVPPVPHPGPAVRQFDVDWWRPLVAQSLRGQDAPRRISLQDVLLAALKHSRQIRVYSEMPLIRESSVTEADAAFDWSAFIDSRWSDSSEPIGSALTAGPGIERFEDQSLNSTVGVRRRTRTGGQFELSQQLGTQKNNSTFFVPNPQATSRLTLSFSQPLLRGAGKCYNESVVVLASLDKQMADFEFRRQLQNHLLEVTTAYWALYLERGGLVQKMNSFRRAKAIVIRLEQRQAIDASGTQIASAQAELKTRSAELLRADTAVRNAESRIRALVNDPDMKSDRLELIPTEAPRFVDVPVDLNGAVSEAIQFRPEVGQSLKRIRATSIRTKMSENELLPVLNLVTEAYAAGIDTDYDTIGAMGRQLDRGNPSYSIGLQYEMPIGNRAARARHIRRHQEMRMARNQYQTVLENIRAEVEVAVRETQTSFQELSAKQQAMQARETQLNQLTQRWERLPGQDVSASLALENLLTSQDRLSDAEYQFLKAQVTYSLSLTNLKKSTGTLLQSESVSIGRGCSHGVPIQMISKPKLAN